MNDGTHADHALPSPPEVVLMTAHPGTNKAAFDVPLSRPRSLRTTAEPEFGRLSFAIWEALRDEVRRALEEQA